jgi:outer membrane protein assembly factor BamB
MTIVCCLICTCTAQAQRGGGDWMTENGDAQRTAWVKADAKINKDSLVKPGFQFLWKMKLKNLPRQMNNLAAPATMERLIGYRGFRMLGFVAGSDDNLFTIDTDLGRMEWEKHLNTSATAQSGTLVCPGGMTTGVARPTTAAIFSGGGGFGPGRNTPAKSTVGEPGAGATTLAAVRPTPQPPPAVPRPNQPGAPGGPGGGPPRGATLIYALASDGMLHAMHLSNGADFQPPVKFLPPGANANGLIVVDGAAYVVTEQGCGGAPNGVWALDLQTKQVANWKANVAGSAGPAFGPDGTLYITTGSGGEVPNSIVALEPKTLRVKGAYSAGQREFSSTPVVFEYKGKTLLAAAAKDGSLHLLDAANLSAALFTTAATAPTTAPGALASWQDSNGARWILAAHTGPLPAGFKAASTAPGSVAPKGAILARKLVEANGQFTLQPGWASRNLAAPLTPTIINGVVFATSSGEFRTNDSKVIAAMRAARSRRAVIYALDGATGKELWNSGATITSFARGGALSGGVGQIYLTTYDGMIYAFGFPMEH